MLGSNLIYQGPSLSNYGQILRRNLLDVKDGNAVKRLHVYALEQVLLLLKVKTRSRTRRGSSELQDGSSEIASDSSLTLVKKISLTNACIRAVATWSVRDGEIIRVSLLCKNAHVNKPELFR